MTHEVRDKRTAPWFWIHNQIIDAYLPRIHMDGYVVYSMLARHANQQGESFPSLSRLSKTLGISRNTVIKAIEALIREGLIEKHTREDTKKGHLSNLYVLKNLPPTPSAPDELAPSSLDEQGYANETFTETKDLPHPSAPDELALVQNMNYPSAPDELALVHQMNPNNTKINKTKNKKEYIVEIDEKNTISTPPREKRLTKAQQDGLEVLAYLNKQSEKRLTKLGLIPARLNDGATVDDCKRVIDWLLEHRNDEWKRQYLNHTNPFRPGNFDKYLDCARASPSGIYKIPQGFSYMSQDEQRRHYVLHVLSKEGIMHPSEEMFQQRWDMAITKGEM